MAKKSSKSSAKSKLEEQAQLLNLLRIVLPKVAPNPALADEIYSACEAELRSKIQVHSFE